MRSLPVVIERTRARLLGVLAIAALTPHAVVAEESAWIPIRLRISVNTQHKTGWQGQLELSQGRLQKLQPLSLTPQRATEVWLDGGVVRLDYTDAPTPDAFDLTADCPPGAELKLTVGREIARLSVDDLRREAGGVWSERGGIYLGASRPTSDRLRVITDRTSLLFEPGEEFAFEVLADPAGFERGDVYDLAATLSSARGEDELWRSEPIRLSDVPARAELAIPLPTREGAYQVTLTATRPSGFFSRFSPISNNAKPTVLLERSFQIAVYDQQQAPRQPGGWLEIYAFDPREHRWADRIPRWMKWPALGRSGNRPQNSYGLSDSRAEQGGAIEIPAAPGAAAHWRAYPLPIDEPGATYAVEVEALGDADEMLSLAVLEPSEVAGQRPIAGPITHIAPRWNRGAAEPAPRLMFRPQSESPTLLIANPSGDSPARFGAIRLWKSLGQQRPKNTQHRSVALTWSEADLPHALGATHAKSPDGKREKPDLATWLETATVLADRLEASGASAAVIPVNEAGSALYPSQAWPNPRWDLDRWDNPAADLPREGGLAIIEREFRRRGLKLLPAIRFDAPAGRLGQDAGESKIADRIAVVEELLDALPATETVAGIVLRNSTSGWGWPTDGVEDPTVVASELLQAEKLIRRRLGSSTGLILSPAELVDRPRIAPLLTPRLGGATANEQVAELLGLAVAPQLKVAKPRGITPAFPENAASRRGELLEALARAIPAAPSVQSARAGRHELRLVDSAEAFKQSEDLRLACWLAEAHAEAAVLAEAASQGAEILAIEGQAAAGWIPGEEASRYARFSQLPMPSKPNGVEAEETDVVATIFETAERQSAAVITNQSAWPQQATISIQTPTRTRGRLMFKADSKDAWFEPGLHPIEVQLEPYESETILFSTPGVVVTGTRLGPAPQARRELAERVADLQSRDTTHHREVSLVANASFEDNQQEGPPLHWTPTGDVRQDRTVAFEGAASLQLHSDKGRPATLVSDAFVPPDTGQLAVKLRAKVDSIEPDARFKIVLAQADGPIRRETVLTGEQLSTAGADRWLPPIIFPVDDLPLGDNRLLQLRVELSGSAALHLDDIRTEDLVLPLDGTASIDQRAERLALVRLMSTTEKLLADGRLESCRKMLDSYWARFLLDNFPAHAPPAVAEESQATEEGVIADHEEQESPTVGERLRGYLPRWWR